MCTKRSFFAKRLQPSAMLLRCIKYNFKRDKNKTILNPPWYNNRKFMLCKICCRKQTERKREQCLYIWCGFARKRIYKEMWQMRQGFFPLWRHVYFLISMLEMWLRSKRALVCKQNKNFHLSNRSNTNRGVKGWKGRASLKNRPARPFKQ